jgi:Zn-dependent protease/CBS domain-containing protein
MVMRSWSVPAGEWKGVHLRVHLAFFFLLLYVWITQSVTADPKITFLRSIGFALIVLLSVAAHETAHLLVLGRSGTLPRAIVLLPIGGLAVAEVTAERLKPEPSRSLRRETMISLAGPAMSFLLALAIALAVRGFAPQVNLWQRPWADLANLPRSTFWVNLFLAALNLLPAYPLDGGKILRAFFATSVDSMTATRRAVNIGNIFVALLMFAGLWDTWLMLAGIFLFFASQLEERTALFQSVLDSVRMEEVMLTDFSTLSPADTLEDALSKAVHTLQDDFPVVRGNDMVGVVSRHKILEALRGEGNAYVQSIMNRAYEVAGRKDSLASAFRKITRHGLTLIPVVDQERLVGIVTLQNLMHSMSVLAESRKLRRMQKEDEEGF